MVCVADWLSREIDLGFGDEADAREFDEAARALALTTQVLSVVRASPDSFHLRWRESTYSNGTLIGVERFTGVATIVIDPPASPERLAKNPLGLYVHSFTWSQDLQP